MNARGIGAGVGFARLPLLFVFLAAGCDRRSEQASPRPAPVVTVAHPARHDVVEWDEFTGRLEAVDWVEVRARVSGFLESVQFTDGALVKKGDLLFVIDPRPYQAEVDRTNAEVARAKAQLQLAADEVKRIESLRTGAATGKEYLDARYNKSAADASVAAAEAAVRAAELNLEFTRVTAPIAGRISRKLITQGNLINGGAGQATLLTTITSLDPIHCYVDADERQILKYQRLTRENKRKSARDVRIPAYLALADETEFTHEGYIDFVDNRLEPGTGTLRARASIPNPDGRFTPGLFARLRVPGSEPYPALLVADQAIIADQAQRFVLLADGDNVVRRHAVAPGALFGSLRVVEGLAPTDWVLINGYQRVRPGAKVDPKQASMPPLPASEPVLTKFFQRTGPATRPVETRPAEIRPASRPVAAGGGAR